MKLHVDSVECWASIPDWRGQKTLRRQEDRSVIAFKHVHDHANLVIATQCKASLLMDWGDFCSARTRVLMKDFECLIEVQCLAEYKVHI